MDHDSIPKLHKRKIEATNHYQQQEPKILLWYKQLMYHNIYICRAFLSLVEFIFKKYTAQKEWKQK